jgi:hypothetical protein
MLMARILVVALQPLVAVVALHVHDGVDAHGVRVGFDAGADHHHLAAHALRNQRVDGVLVQHLEFGLGHL